MKFVRLVLAVAAISTSLSVSAAIEKKPLVFVKKAELAELSEILTYPARVEPRIRAAVVAETDGVVTKIVAPLGSRVKARAALLVIRNTDPVYRYSPMTLTAPVAGIVSRVDVTEGARVARGDKVALVTDPDQSRVLVEVTSDDLRSIRPGQEATMQLPGQKDKTIKLKVRGISPFVDPSTGTATCELELAEKATLPPPGVISRVVFKTNVRQGISLPDSVITYRGKDPFVRVVEGGKARLIAVVLGRKQSGEVEITKGLKAGDVVVERTSKFVAEGEEVEIQEKTADKAAEKTGA